jgi:hypothetical protein
MTAAHVKNIHVAKHNAKLIFGIVNIFLIIFFLNGTVS